jgi:uncharacterized protein (TIGR03435 family)
MRIAIIMAVVAGLCQSQTRFEGASVKPSPTPPTHRAYTMNDGTVDLGAISLKILIQIAYRMQPYQVTSPEWMATTRFDILAKLPAGANKTHIPEMLQALLADRFGLAAHRESKEQQVYALMVGRDGPKLKEGAADNQRADMAAFTNGRRIVNRHITEDGFWSVSLFNGRKVFDAPRITMPELGRMLMPYVEDPVIDMTGLKGVWQVADLEVPREVSLPAMLASMGISVPRQVPEGVSIFASVQKLGLMLEHRKASIEHLVVNHAEKIPTEN